MRTAQRIISLPAGSRALVLATMTVALTLLVFSGSALAASSAPKVQIEPAEQTPTGFRLKAKVNPEGSATTYYFIYKDTGVECEDLEGCGPSTPRGGPLTGDVTQEVQAEVTGLTPGQQYRYWLIARNAYPEDVRSQELTFTTPPADTATPVIESESASNVTEHDATLEAQIDTEGLPTLYQFRLSSICGGRGACLYVINYSLPSGLLLGSFVNQSVSLDLNSAGVTLQPGGTYSYSVSATSSAGTTESPVQTLTTPEGEVEPLSTTTSTPSGSDQPTGSNGNGQPSGSEGSSSSSSSPPPSIGVLGTHVAKTTEPKPPTKAQKLANALKACDKKPTGKRAACEKQARRKYGAVAKKSKR